MTLKLHKFSLSLATIRFYIACFFAPLLALNIHNISKKLVNGEIPKEIVNFDFFTGVAGGAIIFVFPMILLYALHIYLFYLQVYKLAGRWYLYLCYGAIPCIFIGLLELSLELNLNYIGMLYLSFSLSSAFWFLASAKFLEIKSCNIKEIFINVFFISLYFILCVVVHFKYRGLSITVDVIDELPAISSVCITASQLRTDYCKNRPLWIEIYNPYKNSVSVMAKDDSWSCKKGDKLVLTDFTPFVEKIKNHDIKKINFTPEKCIQ